MSDYKKHLVDQNAGVKEALAKLNILASDAILFVVDEHERLIGSLTDGDIRRGFLGGLGLESSVLNFIQNNPKFLKKGDYTVAQVIEYRNKGLRIVPVLDTEHRIVKILNFRFHKSYLPIDAIIMAGGRGERLKPLTDNTPKPLLKVGDKPIIEHNVDHLISYGIDDIWISVRYLGEQLEDYFRDGASKGTNIKYIWETKPLGTIGAASKVEVSEHDYVLVINSDLLTNLDFEDFFQDFIAKDAMLSVASIPYSVNVPYAIMEMNGEHVTSLREKPTYTYPANAGIYLMKKECLKLIPNDEYFDTTDLMELLISEGQKVSNYALRGYWLDIGKHEDYIKAQEDIKHIKF
ncbi:nucleotidyltransferase family protein [Mucilaginibacter sp.]|uniref:nucleotidyltransferase family protein n=1 Tax=Mucilaginibacter sp. TaxID=1882438 RepID=UPI0025F901E8|nr:nucleotidyltransferase family protein [Mucilaginibacter sp.]